MPALPRELDPAEITCWTKEPEQQALDREHGYGDTVANPAVVHLNGLAVHAAMAEPAAWISGHQQPAQYLDIDLFGCSDALTILPDTTTASLLDRLLHHAVVIVTEGESYRMRTRGGGPNT